MASIYGIIPEYILYRESIAAAPRQRTSQGIISFYILESLSRNAVIEQQCEAARHTLAYSTKYRTDITATRRPNRIRDFFDNKGMKLDGFIYAGDFYNAFYNGREFVFGDGDGVIFDGFTDKLDVIAYEVTYGVSGALNKSIVDVFGIMTVDQANWLIGEGIFATDINGKALQDMANPGTAYNEDRKLPFSDDNGGVHVNSGIPNRAFHLAATKIGGYAWEGAGPIWYRALSSGKLRTNGKAKFKDFADLTIENAGVHVDKIREAWELVGYPFPEKRNKL
ncbi:hypothetical protein BDV35DRAFT_406592 [Aspergillus flavus]|uniref:Peptidase M4 C-terminal domain-containing protein n=1 Tax=Aspergillus flavus TaxID=5059 RepID=A0A5N6GSM4_ASPFL|nr:hypothetical protein BDV35DRAFT_406592 [Aspergillus flavus]